MGWVGVRDIVGKLIPEVSNFTMRSSSPRWGWRWEGDILGKIIPEVFHEKFQSLGGRVGVGWSRIPYSAFFQTRSSLGITDIQIVSNTLREWRLMITA